MTPEEKFIRGIWEALKRIKENALYTKKGEPVAVASSLIDERALGILGEWQVIKIRENPWEPPMSTKNIFYLDVNRRRVNELDSLCKNGFEANVSPEKLLEIIKEWVHPLGKDEKLSFEILELIKGKKKAVKIAPKVRAEEIRKLFEEEKRIEEIARRVIEKNQKIKKPTDKWLIFHTKEGVELKFNKESGDFVFGRVDGNFALETNEYKIFLCLLESPSHMAKYTTLLKLMYPDKEFEEPLKKYQVEMWALNSVIRDIKIGLGILPKKKFRNKNAFQTLKKWKGYRLRLTD